MQQVHIIITGIVQGVGFRYFVKSHAKKLRIVGWVKNTEEGTVEAMLQGEKTAIEKLLAYCHEGPPLSHVIQIEVTWVENIDLFPDFSILHG